MKPPEKPKTIQEQWIYYNMQCMHGDAPRHGFELMYYLGAGAYQNILSVMHKDLQEKKMTSDEAVKLIEQIQKEIEKRLYELTEV